MDAVSPRQVSRASHPGERRQVTARDVAAIAAPMSDRVFFSLLALAAVAMIALALVWPQGQGRRSPAPFGHAVVAPAPVAAPAPSPATKATAK